MNTDLRPFVKYPTVHVVGVGPGRTRCGLLLPVPTTENLSDGGVCEECRRGVLAASWHEAAARRLGR